MKDVNGIEFELISLFKQPDDSDSSSGTDDGSGSSAVPNVSEDERK